MTKRLGTSQLCKCRFSALVFGSVPHDRAAADVRRLILRDVVWAFTILLDDLLGAHRLKDLREFVGQERVLLDLIVVEIHGDPRQRAAEAILVGRIKIDIDVAVAVHAAVNSGPRLQCTLIVFFSPPSSTVAPHRGVPGGTGLVSIGLPLVCTCPM